MTAKARGIFSTEDGRLAMSEAEGWVLTTIMDLDGEVGQNARMALSELLVSMQELAARLETVGDSASRPVEVLLGFTSEGEQMYAAVTEHGMTIVELAPDGVGRRLLCGPYSVDEARRMVNAVVQASAR